MKAFAKAALALVVLTAAPTLVFAQSFGDGPAVTRAETRQHLAELEAAGYSPNDWAHYPQNLQTAQERVASARTTTSVASTRQHAGLSE